MDREQMTVRTMRVRYSMVFVFTVGLLFFVSQVLDNIFYDYTVVETEIIFIKRVSDQNDIEIELNEITDPSNSLVSALKSHILSTVDFVHTKQLASRLHNFQFKASFSKLSQNSIMQPISKESGDSLYMLSIKNQYSPLSMTSVLRVYYDIGHNFFDLSQALTISNEWFLLNQYVFHNMFVFDVDQDGSKLLLHLKNESSSRLDVLDLLTNETESVTLNSQLTHMDYRNDTIVYSRALDKQLFRIMQKQDGLWVPVEVQHIHLDPRITYSQTLNVKFLNSSETLFVLYILIIDEEVKVLADLYTLRDGKFIKTFSLFNRDITEHVNFRDLQKLDFRLDIIHNYDQASNQLVLCMLNKFLVPLRIYPQMYEGDPYIYQNKFIRFYGFEVEEVIFRKVQYSQQDHSVYILTETKSQRYKIYHLDLKQIEDQDHSDIYKIRMPFFSPERVIKDFQVQKDLYGNIVLVLIFDGGEVAGIQILQYGEGVLNKTFMIELMDIILTLAFIGFFRFIKRLFNRIQSKFTSLFRRII